jgi:fructose-specific phosphotransferase system IIC component
MMQYSFRKYGAIAAAANTGGKVVEAYGLGKGTEGSTVGRAALAREAAQHVVLYGYVSP